MVSVYENRLGEPPSEVKIIVVADEADDSLRELKALPANANVLFRGSSEKEFSTNDARQALGQANVLLNCNGGKALLSGLWPHLTQLRWMHSRWAGVDSLLFPELVDGQVMLTNSRGVYSPSLAEHAILSCLYFAKDVPRWKRQQQEKKWEQFVVREVRGATMGIIGYGDIGRTAAKLGKALGMKILAQRRRPEQSEGDELVDGLFGVHQVGDVIEKSDYIVVAAALTPQTKHMIGTKELARADCNAILINIGRGPLIDEAALVQALQEGRLRGAALDVFEQEPLPESSPLWGMDNVLLSPHSTDMTATFLHESVRAFVDAVKPYLSGEAVQLHMVDKKQGY